MSTPRGLRNRNPGNLEASPWTQNRPGYAGKEPEGRFATFTTMAHGVAALMSLLVVYRESHGLRTVRGIINRWAPTSENNTSAYVSSVARALHVDPDEDLPDSAGTYVALAEAIAKHECGRDAATAAISDSDYTHAAAIVFGDYAAQSTEAAAADSQPAGAAPPESFSSSPKPAPAATSSPEFTMPAIGPLVLAAGQILYPIVADLFKAHGSKTATSNAEIIERAAPALVEVAKTVTGQGTAEQAVAAIQSDVRTREAFRAAVSEDMDRIIGAIARLVEIDDASADRAAERAKGETWDSAQYLAQRGEMVMLIALGMLFAGLVAAFYFKVGDAYIGAIAALFVSTITAIVQNWGKPREYRWGSSAGSKASGDAIRMIAEKQK